MDWGCEVGQVVLSKPKVLQEPREEQRHPGFNQLSKFLSGFTGGEAAAAGGGAAAGKANDGMSAIIRQLAPQLAASPQLSNDAAGARPPSICEGAEAPAPTEVSGVAVALSGGVVGATSSPSSVAAPKPNNQIEELARLFLGVLGGVLTEKLVRSINSTYEVKLENVDGIGGDPLQFYLDLKHGLGQSASEAAS